MNIREKLANKTFGHYSYNFLDTNEKIHCNEGNSYGKFFFVYGFSSIEPMGRWSNGDTSIIRFKCDYNSINKLLIKVSTLPNINQNINIEVNEMDYSDIFVDSEQTLEFPLRKNKDYPNEAIITFKYYNVKTPKELGLNDDEREMALFFHSIELI